MATHRNAVWAVVWERSRYEPRAYAMCRRRWRPKAIARRSCPILPAAGRTAQPGAEPAVCPALPGRALQRRLRAGVSGPVGRRRATVSEHDAAPEGRLEGGVRGLEAAALGWPALCLHLVLLNLCTLLP